MHTSRNWLNARILFGSVFSLGLLATAGFAQARYDFILVDSFNANPLAGEAYLWDINDVGMACGQATVDNVIGYPGFVWEEQTGKTRISVASPQSLNNNGLIVGIGDILDLSSGQIYSPPNLPGTYYAPQFGGVNDAGVAVGSISTCSCSDSGGVLRIPYIWDAVNGARTIDVPNAKGLLRVNSAGMAIGWLNGWAANEGFVVNLETAEYTVLGDVFPPGYGAGITRVYDISDSGVVVGARTTSSSVYGFAYSLGSGFQILPFPGAGYQQVVRPRGISNTGTIVGDLLTTTASARCFVFSPADGLIDLATAGLVAGMPAGYRFYSAQKINDQGWIVGYGYTAGGKITGWVLIPHTVPGDVDGDGHVDLGDLTLLLSSFGLCSGESSFNPAADFNGNGCVELADLAVLLANFGA
ncbi:MAG: hypothetical protein HZB38_19010 [Planctomycetes bacterium]|nr:hypothetical protein [Planctomycetota bacterium]